MTTAHPDPKLEDELDEILNDLRFILVFGPKTESAVFTERGFEGAPEHDKCQEKAKAVLLALVARENAKSEKRGRAKEVEFMIGWCDPTDELPRFNKLGLEDRLHALTQEDSSVGGGEQSDDNTL